MVWCNVMLLMTSVTDPPPASHCSLSTFPATVYSYTHIMSGGGEQQQPTFQGFLKASGQTKAWNNKEKNKLDQVHTCTTARILLVLPCTALEYSSKSSIRPGKLGLLFHISHLLNLHVSGRSLFITGYYVANANTFGKPS